MPVNSRRKSRPLLPHELVPHFRNGVPIEVLQHSPQGDGLEQEAPSHSLHASMQDCSELNVHSRASSIHELLNPSSSSESKTPASASSIEERANEDVSPLSSFELPVDRSQPTSSYVSSDTRPEQDDKTSSGRKRVHADMAGEVSRLVSTAIRESPRLGSQGSVVRLSMTAEGAVKIRTSDQETPSPPKERTLGSETISRTSSGLQRSKSAIEASEMGAQSSPLLATSKIADGKLGRSRDARTWEFYCDSEARDSLSSHAEHERNGSAVGAINLIRSQSQRYLRQMLAPVASRSNARAPTPLGSGAQKSKGKLVRARSSLGRLQAVNIDSGKKYNKDPQPKVARSPSGDSDKENWEPGAHMPQYPPRRMKASSNGRAVLADNDSVLSYASGLINEGHIGIRAMDGKENKAPIPVSSKEKGSDLDCVQGLLSLSQGAWR